MADFQTLSPLASPFTNPALRNAVKGGSSISAIAAGASKEQPGAAFSPMAPAGSSAGGVPPPPAGGAPPPPAGGAPPLRDGPGVGRPAPTTPPPPLRPPPATSPPAGGGGTRTEQQAKDYQGMGGEQDFYKSQAFRDFAKSISPTSGYSTDWSTSQWAPRQFEEEIQNLLRQQGDSQLRQQEAYQRIKDAHFQDYLARLYEGTSRQA